MIVRFIISSTHSSVDGVSLVDGEEEDNLPDAPEGDSNNGKNDGAEQVSSSASVIFSEEVNHLTCSNSNWDQKEKCNENVPPWEVFIQKLEECNGDQNDSK